MNKVEAQIWMLVDVVVSGLAFDTGHPIFGSVLLVLGCYWAARYLSANN